MVFPTNKTPHLFCIPEGEKVVEASKNLKLLSVCAKILLSQLVVLLLLCCPKVRVVPGID
jgi:hypothetical protein